MMRKSVIASMCLVGVLSLGCSTSKLHEDADLNIPSAQYRYGLQLISQDNYIDGKRYILKAVKAGDSEALGFWGVYSNWVDTLILADDGDINAQREVGYSYSLDNSPVSTVHDTELTVYWLSKAFNGGDHESAYLLGELYSEGRVFIKNEKEAFEWFLQSATAGNANAMYEVYKRYYAGKGVKQDTTKAEYWLKAAGIANHIEAKDTLIKYYMSGENPNYGWALQWLVSENDVASVRSLLPYMTKLSTLGEDSSVYKSFNSNDVLGSINAGSDLYAIYFEGDWVEVYSPKQKLLGVMSIDDVSIKKTGRDWALKTNYNLCKAECDSLMCYQSNADGTSDSYSYDTIRASMCLTF